MQNQYVFRSVMVLGPVGCGKTTVWKTLMACHNRGKTKPSTVAETVNPKVSICVSNILRTVRLYYHNCGFESAYIRPNYTFLYPMVIYTSEYYHILITMSTDLRSPSDVLPTRSISSDCQRFVPRLESAG